MTEIVHLQDRYGHYTVVAPAADKAYACGYMPAHHQVPVTHNVAVTMKCADEGAFWTASRWQYGGDDEA